MLIRLEAQGPQNPRGPCRALLQGLEHPRISAALPRHGAPINNDVPLEEAPVGRAQTSYLSGREQDYLGLGPESIENYFLLSLHLARQTYCFEAILFFCLLFSHCHKFLLGFQWCDGLRPCIHRESQILHL